MAPHANCKGFLRLSLVTCPVALYPATSENAVPPGRPAKVFKIIASAL